MPANSDEAAVRALYRAFIDAWNARDAKGMAACFSADANMVGFDGSQASGANGIEEHLAPIFASHPTAPYYTIVKSVRFPAEGAAVLQAIAGMVPPGQSDINPAVNAIQSMMAVKRGGAWKIELLQTTPAALHGQDEAKERMTEALRAAFRAAK
jgi:uncharacterized protein (TIGR02246 family)